MSYKQEFQSNNVDIQSLIDLAKTLPDAENLDSEIATQDDLINQIASALEWEIKSSLPSCIATGNTAPLLNLQDINGNIIFEKDDSDTFTIDLSDYIGDIVSIITDKGCTIDVVIDEYAVSIPVTSGTISPYVISPESYYFVVPNHNITININEPY